MAVYHVLRSNIPGKKMSQIGELSRLLLKKFYGKHYSANNINSFAENKTIHSYLGKEI